MVPVLIKRNVYLHSSTWQTTGCKSLTVVPQWVFVTLPGMSLRLKAVAVTCSAPQDATQDRFHSGQFVGTRGWVQCSGADGSCADSERVAIAQVLWGDGLGALNFWSTKFKMSGTVREVHSTPHQADKAKKVTLIPWNPHPGGKKAPWLTPKGTALYLNKDLENENGNCCCSWQSWSLQLLWLSMKNSFDSAHLLNVFMCGAPERMHAVKGREKCFHSTLGILTIFIMLAYN